MRAGPLYRELIAKNFLEYHSLRVEERAPFVETKIIDAILKAGGRFLLKQGKKYQVLSLDNDSVLIHKKIRRAFSNEKNKNKSAKKSMDSHSATATTQVAMPVGENPSLAIVANAMIHARNEYERPVLDMMEDEQTESVLGLGFSFDNSEALVLEQECTRTDKNAGSLEVVSERSPASNASGSASSLALVLEQPCASVSKNKRSPEEVSERSPAANASGPSPSHALLLEQPCASAVKNEEARERSPAAKASGPAPSQVLVLEREYARADKNSGTLEEARERSTAAKTSGLAPSQGLVLEKECASADKNAGSLEEARERSPATKASVSAPSQALVLEQGSAIAEKNSGSLEEVYERSAAAKASGSAPSQALVLEQEYSSAETSGGSLEEIIYRSPAAKAPGTAPSQNKNAGLLEEINDKCSSAKASSLAPSQGAEEAEPQFATVEETDYAFLFLAGFKTRDRVEVEGNTIVAHHEDTETAARERNDYEAEKSSILQGVDQGHGSTPQTEKTAPMELTPSGLARNFTNDSLYI